LSTPRTPTRSLTVSTPALGSLYQPITFNECLPVLPDSLTWSFDYGLPGPSGSSSDMPVCFCCKELHLTGQLHKYFKERFVPPVGFEPTHRYSPIYDNLLERICFTDRCRYVGLKFYKTNIIKIFDK